MRIRGCASLNIIGGFGVKNNALIHPYTLTDTLKQLIPQLKKEKTL